MPGDKYINSLQHSICTLSEYSYVCVGFLHWNKNVVFSLLFCRLINWNLSTALYFIQEDEMWENKLDQLNVNKKGRKYVAIQNTRHFFSQIKPRLLHCNERLNLIFIFCVIVIQTVHLFTKSKLDTEGRNDNRHREHINSLLFISKTYKYSIYRSLLIFRSFCS